HQPAPHSGFRPRTAHFAKCGNATVHRPVSRNAECRMPNAESPTFNVLRPLRRHQTHLAKSLTAAAFLFTGRMLKICASGLAIGPLPNPACVASSGQGNCGQGNGGLFNFLFHKPLLNATCRFRKFPCPKFPCHLPLLLPTGAPAIADSSIRHSSFASRHSAQKQPPT